MSKFRTEPESSHAAPRPAKQAVPQLAPAAAAGLAFQNSLFEKSLLRLPKPAGLAMDDPVPAASPALNDGAAITGGSARPCLVIATSRVMPARSEVTAVVLGMPLLDEEAEGERGQ